MITRRLAHEQVLRAQDQTSAAGVLGRPHGAGERGRCHLHRHVAASAAQVAHDAAKPALLLTLRSIGGPSKAFDQPIRQVIGRWP
jgi:hypothetical protein